MATKKKTKQPKAKRTAGKKPVPVKKKAVKKKAGKSKKTAKKATATTKSPSKKATARKPVGAPKGRSRNPAQNAAVDTVESAGRGARSGGQSGDLQGLSDMARADSESVDELLEEGNSFEAEAVKGVEEAGDLDERGVHTHEVPEDDVPGEYLDKD